MPKNKNIDQKIVFITCYYTVYYS